MKRPDHKTIINQTVWHAAAIMSDKAEELRLIAGIFADKKTPEDDEQARRLTAEAEEVETAVKLIDKREGSWA